MAAPSKPVEHTGHRGSVRGRPSLGDREHVTAALWPSLEALVDEERGSLNRSPFLADLLAWHVGRPDLIRHKQLTIEFEFTAEFPARAAAVLDAAKPAGTKTRHCTVRVHPDVAHELEERRKRTGQARGVFIANAIAESLGVTQTHTSANEEGLPLAM
jgi:hypothetical protein